MNTLNIAATGLTAAQQFLDVTSNNIANSETIAFKRQYITSSDLEYNNVNINRSNEEFNHNNSFIGNGTRVMGTFPSNVQGPLEQTNNALHLAIFGNGYFIVENPSNGERFYTRAGNFRLNSKREIVNSEGYCLLDNSGQTILVPEISIDLKSLRINQNGEINFINEVGESLNYNLEIPLYLFPNQDGLRPLGYGLYQKTNSSGDPFEVRAGEHSAGTISQGSIEGSNTNTAIEMVNLIKAQKSYEINLKVVKVAENIMSAGIDLIA